MARLAVLASGNGSNFQAIAEAIRRESSRAGSFGTHECVLLIYDRKAAYARQRAELLGIPSRYVSYYERDSRVSEAEITIALEEARVDLVALAGFMRLLSPDFVEARKTRIINIHPSLLPKWPGSHAIERAFKAGEREFGATVHYVDSGMDTGPSIDSRSFVAESRLSLEQIEEKIHAIEHELFPRVAIDLLDAIDESRRRP